MELINIIEQTSYYNSIEINVKTMREFHKNKI